MRKFLNGRKIGKSFLKGGASGSDAPRQSSGQLDADKIQIPAADSMER